MKRCGLILLLPVMMFASDQIVSGVVFNDVNGNRLRDSGEKGIAGVLVSNEREVVKTDRKGYYELPLREEMMIFITKPAGYNVPLNEQNIPRFWYLHMPGGSPEALKPYHIPPTGALPESLDFPLIKSKVKKNFTAIISGDPQPRDSVEIGYLRDDIIREMAGVKAEFYLALGDITFNRPQNYEMYNQVVSTLNMPAYNVAGNHDMSFKAMDDFHATDYFRYVYGPTNFSFDYGMVHFIVLDDVDYAGYNTDEQKHGKYRGYFSEQQLAWLKNDLTLVPVDRLIVFNMHIPLVTGFDDTPWDSVVNRDAFFKLLEGRKHLLALSAHMHYIEHRMLDEKAGWQSPEPFTSINAGAACGAWWSGPKDKRGIPASDCLDGSPNGYYEFHFKDNTFSYDYIPADEPRDFQMRVSWPEGMVHADSLRNLPVTVNIFAAAPGTQVSYSLDNGENLTMTQQTIEDPYMLKYIAQRQYFPGWIDAAVAGNHIWTRPLPDTIEPGTHSIHVTATEPGGIIFKGFTIFNVE